MSDFCQVLVSSPTREEAGSIADELVQQRLVAGCLIRQGAARYWWNGEVVQRQYWNIEAFSVPRHKSKIIELVEMRSSDECPIVAFTAIDGSAKFLNWIGAEVEREENYVVR